MNKLFTTIFAVAVSCATAASLAQEIKGDAKAGETKNAMCIGCHGIKGYQASFPEVYKVPMISGQGAKYIVAALNEYKKGERKHPTMRAIADTLTEQDMADLAAYYAQLGMKDSPALPATAPAPADKVQALITRDKDNSCTKCHGANFSTPNDGTVPKLAGQHADYLTVALKQYKTDGHGIVGRSNAVMGGQAKKFSNAEIKELASYISGLPGDLKTVPESRFHRAD